jgi:hypothetical protein
VTYTAAPKWTPAELEIMRANYATKTRKEMMVLLPNRSDFSIGSKAQDMGLKCLVKNTNINVNRPEWSDWEKFHLQKVYADHTIYELLEMFPARSRQSIEQRAHSLGLKKNADVVTRTRIASAKKTKIAQAKAKWDESEEAGTKLVIVNPAPNSDSLVRKAISVRTPLEQAWSVL